MKYAFEKSGNLYAITIMQEFFDYYGLRLALQSTTTMLNYAMHRKYYRETEPYALVFLADWLRKLIPACLTLEKEYWLQKSFEVAAGEKGLPDLNRLPDFMPDNSAALWHYIPKHVNIKQYLNPINALKQLRKYQSEAEWIKTIDDLLEYALCRASINECYPPYNMTRLCTCLLQVIEACHLILIRYNQKISSGSNLNEN